MNVRTDSIPRRNNFDILRLVFASIVVLAHSAELTENAALSWIPHILSQRLAVEGFFTISGCLVVASYHRSSTLASYFEKRARRILPLYWLVISFGVCLGVLFSSVPLLQFVTSFDLCKYVAAQVSFANFLQPNLPGLFTNNVMAAVNGSLWTIKVEVMFYLSVPIICHICTKCKPWKVLAGIFAASIAYRLTCEHLHHDSLAVQLPGQLSYFIIGTAIYYYYPDLIANRKWVWSVAVVGFCGYLWLHWLWLRIVSVCLMTGACGLLLPVWEGPTKYGDFSYGVYVFHWPVIQVLTAYGVFMAQPGLGVGAVIAIVGALSIVSWYVVEQPFLVRRAVEQSGPKLLTAKA